MRLFRRRAEERSIPSGGPVWPTDGWAPFAPASSADALQIADVFACVRCLSDAAASIPLIPYRRTSSGRQRLLSGKLYDLLQQPAPAVTQASLIGMMVAHLNLHGNAFLGKFKDTDGRLEQLALLQPDRVTVKQTAGEPTYLVSDPKTGQETRHGTDDIVHIKGMTTDGLVGLSPIQQCRMAVSLAQGLGEFAEAFIRNGARPSGIIKLPVGSNATFKEFQDTLANRHGGARNAHKVAVVSGDIEWTPMMAAPPDDLQFVQQRHLSTQEIARIFRVPAWMIGAETGASQTYANVEQESTRFVVYSLRPWLVAIEQRLSVDPDLCSERQYVEFLVDALLRGDSKTRAEVYALALDPLQGWMRRDEVRRLENLEPEDASSQPTRTETGALIA